MISRRGVLQGAGALALAPKLVWADALDGPEALVAKARARAKVPYSDPNVVLAAPFDRLDYDRYRAVRPVSGKSARLPLGDKFRADLLPPGWLFRTPVAISLPGHDTTFAPDMFQYDPSLIDLPATWPDMAHMGFSGLRLLHPLNRPDIWDEVLVLQGASYFRALAQGTVYGKSARAFSLGTGAAAPEEFPVTEEIHVFAAGESVQFGCLVDCLRASAALIATLTPGRVTQMQCSLHLFPRETLQDVGIAPLTSMFQHSALGPARIDDFRPSVHDSDVLVVDNGAGERLWRPLANPAQVQMSAFQDHAPRGFGLLQGPTDFAAYRDAEAQYHRRPSAWVRPRGDWGRGAVMLLEIPTDNEFADNIVAFWRPDAPLGPGAHRFDYDLDWLPPGPEALPDAGYPLRVTNMASGVEPNSGTARLFVLDLAGVLDADTQPAIEGGPGVSITGVALYPLPDDGPARHRLSFLLTPDEGTDSAELRLRLSGRDGNPLAPLWLYRWTRRRDGGV